MAERFDPDSPKRWWLRPLKAMALGVSIGLALGWALAQLPERQASVGLIMLCIVAVLFCVAMLQDLKREKAEFEAHMQQLRRRLDGDF